MKRTITFVLLLAVVAMIGIPGAVTISDYLTAFQTLYTDGSCSTCHIGDPSNVDLTSYGQSFQAQANHADNPTAALQAIGPAPGTSPKATATPTVTATATATPTVTITATATPIVTVTATATPIVTVTATRTPRETETPEETETPKKTPKETPKKTPKETPEKTPKITRTPHGQPIPVPEFPTVVLPVAAVMGLVMLLLYRRK